MMPLSISSRKLIMTRWLTNQASTLLRGDRMPTINGKACVANGKNLYLYPKAIRDEVWTIGSTKVTVEPFDSTTNMWHIVAPHGSGIAGIYLSSYAKTKIPDNSDLTYSADIKGTGKAYMFGIEAGSKNPVVGTIGSEWSRISQTGNVGITDQKTLVMYFDTDSSPLDVYVKMPKLELGITATPLTPAPVDKVFRNGKQVYGRNLIKNGDAIYSWVGEHNITKNYGAFIYDNAPFVPAMYQIEARAIDDSIVGVDFGWQWDGGLQGESIKLSTDWQKATALLEANKPLGLRVIGGLGLIELRFIKAEYGTTPTPYSPAPEDVM